MMEIKDFEKKIKYHQLQIRKIEKELAEYLGVTKLNGKRLTTMHIREAKNMIGNGMNKTKVARLLGISRVTLYRATDDNFRLRQNELVNIRQKKYYEKNKNSRSVSRSV